MDIFAFKTAGRLVYAILMTWYESLFPPAGQQPVKFACNI